ncbi:MAG: hypothetical protein P4L83_08800 [Nevskia sp.]|nr:hypothetical protein [Nevskia sp.]
MLTCTDASGSGVGTASVTVGPVPAPTVTINVSPSSIQPGQVAVVYWSTTNASTCSASGGDGDDNWTGSQPTSGTFNVTAPSTTGTYSYVLSCTGPGGSGANVTNLFVSSSLMPTVTITATPASVAVGGSSSLTWSSTNVSVCSASGNWSGSQPTANAPPSYPVGPFNTAGVYNYTLTCGGPNGSASSSTTVTVGTPPPPTVTIAVNPVSIQPGQSSIITWSSTNATSCTASGSWSGSEPLSGTSSTGVLSNAGAYSYTLVCTGPSGSAAANALLTVSGASVADDCGIGQPSTGLLATPYVESDASSGGCLGCSVSQPQNVVTPGVTQATKPYSVINNAVGILGTETLTVGPSLSNTTPTVFPIGRTVGFIVAAPNELLTASLLRSVSLSTELAGKPADGPVTLASGTLGVGLLTIPVGNVNGGFLSFQASRPFDTVQVSNGGLLSVIGQLDVYEACVSNQ